MITNPDGSEYRLVGSIQQFDPGSQDYELLNDLDAENFFLYGAPALYYEIFIQPQTVDPLYLEERGKHWCPNPIELWGIYEPKNSGNIPWKVSVVSGSLVACGKAKSRATGRTPVTSRREPGPALLSLVWHGATAR